MKYKSIKIISLFVILTFLSNHVVIGQYFETPKEKKTIKDKLFFGGGLGLQFGDVTLIEFAPLVGYKVTERFQPGIGLTYSYYNDKRFTFPVEYSTYGGSAFTRFFLFEGLFAHLEAEALNIKVFYNANETNRQWIENYLVGGGYFQKMGEKAGVYILVLWNLNQTELTPYNNPVVRIGFNF